MPAHETCRSPGEDKCPVGHSLEPELQEEGIKVGEEGLNAGVEAGEERGPKPPSSIVRGLSEGRAGKVGLMPGDS